jgi:hypothetical protein
MLKAKTYYDFLPASEKVALAEEFKAGPQPVYEGVHPDCDENQRLRVGEKRFNNKFYRNPHDCPMGVNAEHAIYDTRPVVARLLAEKYLTVLEVPDCEA